MTLTCYLLPPSPNNVKVLVALAAKNVAFDPVLVNPTERGPITEATGQPLTPAIVHDGIKLFDSHAIVRYLDANFPGPQLFSSDYAELKEIEGWERYMRNELGPIISRVFTYLFSEDKDANEPAAICAAFNAATADVEARLEGRDWLVGDRMTAADIFVASFLCPACLTEEQAANHEFWSWMHANLDLGEGREQTRAMAQRVLALMPSFAALAR